MQILSRAIQGVRQRPNGGRVGRPPPLRWPPALALRDTPLTAAASALPDRHLDLLSRFRCIRVRGEKWQSKPQMLVHFASAATKCMDTGMRQETATKCTNKKEIRKIATNEVTSNNCTAVDNIWFPTIIANSSHRDGTIFKNRLYWDRNFDVDITDRNESQLEPMMYSEDTKRCIPDPENCMSHFTCDMMQIFSLTLVKSLINNSPIQLYGYIAVRDDRDHMLNYVFNYSRDDPIIVQQGSLIQMTGPKRGIEMICPVLMEFDVRVKSGEQADDDLQLIDGAIVCREQTSWRPVKHRICGNSGAVDIAVAVVEHAVEATIEVVISEVHTGFRLSLSSFVDVMDDYEEIQLFHGPIGESCALRRFVVAATIDTFMLFQFKVGDSNDDHYCSFIAKRHGCATRQIRSEVACAYVKVTWSTIE